MPLPIQLDPVFSYQQAALAETYRALCQTHGKTFATYFVDEYKEQLLRAANNRCADRLHDYPKISVFARIGLPPA
jgi:hypothetical protein